MAKKKVKKKATLVIKNGLNY